METTSEQSGVSETTSEKGSVSDSFDRPKNLGEGSDSAHILVSGLTEEQADRLARIEKAYQERIRVQAERLGSQADVIARLRAELMEVKHRAFKAEERIIELQNRFGIDG